MPKNEKRFDFRWRVRSTSGAGKWKYYAATVIGTRSDPETIGRVIVESMKDESFRVKRGDMKWTSKKRKNS